MNIKLDTDRAIILLKAARNLLKKCNDSSYVINAASTVVYYDQAECDGFCLMEDIEYLLEDAGINLEETNDPCT